MKPYALRSSPLRQTASMVYHCVTLPFAERELNKLAQLPHEPTRVANVMLSE